MLDRSSLATPPVNNVEAAARFGIGVVGDDAEVRYAVALIEQIARANEDR